jgi:hypothetical protein
VCSPLAERRKTKAQTGSLYASMRTMADVVVSHQSASGQCVCSFVCPPPSSCTPRGPARPSYDPHVHERWTDVRSPSSLSRGGDTGHALMYTDVSEKEIQEYAYLRLVDTQRTDVQTELLAKVPVPLENIVFSSPAMLPNNA